jgi:hypothetical protein
LGLVVGGVTGVGVGAARAKQNDLDAPAMARQAALTGGAVAATGASVGLLLDRRSRRRRAIPKARDLLAGGEILGAARILGPVALEALHHAAEATRPRLEGAVDAARPRITAAATSTARQAERLAESARPVLETAARSTATHASRLADDVLTRTRQAA